MGTLREYVCCVGRRKGSMYLVNARLVVRNAANSLQIGNGGVVPGDPTHGGGGGGWRDGGRDHIYLKDPERVRRYILTY